MLRDSRGNTFQLVGQLDLPTPRKYESPPARDVIAVLLGRTPKRLRVWLFDKICAYYRRYAEDGPLPAPADEDLFLADELLSRISRRATNDREPITGTLHVSGHFPDRDQ